MGGFVEDSKAQIAKKCISFAEQNNKNFPKIKSREDINNLSKKGIERLKDSAKNFPIADWDEYSRILRETEKNTQVLLQEIKDYKHLLYTLQEVTQRAKKLTEKY